MDQRHCRPYFFIALLLLALPLAAQTSRKLTREELRREFIRDIIREKMRYTPEQILRALQDEKTALPRGAAGMEAPSGQIVVSNDPGPESEVHAAINPLDSSNIVISPIKLGASAVNGLTCPIYYTRDFGRSWKKSTFVAPPNDGTRLALGGGDPVFAFDADGKLYFTWISLWVKGSSFDTTHFGMYWAYSTDGGATWRQEQNNLIGSGIGTSTDDLEIFDKQWLAVDRSGSSFRNTLYAAFTQGSGSGADLRISIRRKSPASNAFTQTSVPVSDPSFLMVQFSSIEVDSKGNVHVAFFGAKEAGQWALWHSVSTDGAASFSAPTKIADVSSLGQFAPDFDGSQFETIPGIEGRRIYPCPHLAIDPSQGETADNLYMVWTANGTNSRKGDGLDIYFSRSTDGGASWSEEPSIVNSDPRGAEVQQFYPSISINGNGVIAVTWYDQREDAGQSNTRLYMAYSFDGGASFTENFPVSTEATDFQTVGEMNGNFGIGEYTQVLETNGYAIPVWADGRANDGNLNIYAAFVPISSQPVPGGVDRIEPVTDAFQLLDPIPNPVTGSESSVGVWLKERLHLKLTMVDVTGRSVASLADAFYQPGEHRFPIPVEALAPGTYYCHLMTERGAAVRTVTVVK
jgi:hypothetical protein